MLQNEQEQYQHQWSLSRKTNKNYT